MGKDWMNGQPKQWVPGCVMLVVGFALLALMYASDGASGRQTEGGDGLPQDSLAIQPLSPTAPPATHRPTIPVRLPRLEPHTGNGDSPSPYAEGYDEGYEQGLDDGVNGHGHDYGYDESTRYHGNDATRYTQGYDDGYNDGYAEGRASQEDD